MLPGDRGTYLLSLNLREVAHLTIGRLGSFDFLPGWYGYIGSAFGAGGLRGRLKHHLTPVTKPHWHIDYLRHAAIVTEVWYLASPIPSEHQWAAVVQSLPGTSIPVLRFGASDCLCPAHLFYRATQPDFDEFRQRIHAPELLMREKQPDRLHFPGLTWRGR